MVTRAQQDQPTFRHRGGRRKAYQAGKVIVRVKEDAVRPAFAEGLTLSAANARRLPDAVANPMRFLRDNAGLSAVKPLFSQKRQLLERVRGLATRQSLGVLSSVADSKSEDLSGISVLSMDEDSVTTSLLRTLRSSDVFEYVERAPTRWLSAQPDPMQNLQWGLRAIRWFQAAPPSAQRINVGVLDSGIDMNHPELDGVIDHYERAGLKKSDVIGHGTHVAGIIAAITNNGAGITGVARCRLKIWKVFPDEPDTDGEFYLDLDRYFRALEQAESARCKVVNLSLGGSSPSQTEELVLKRLEREAIVVVAAMGNEYQYGNPTEYPAAYASTIAVGSVAQNLRRSPFSNTGDHIHVTAPGSNILSTLPGRTSAYRDESEYAAWSGTSMATPHVAGLVALLMAKHSGLYVDDVREMLKLSAIKVPGMRNRTSSPSYGYGLIDVEAALKRQRP